MNKADNIWLMKAPDMLL